MPTEGAPPGAPGGCHRAPDPTVLGALGTQAPREGGSATGCRAATQCLQELWFPRDATVWTISGARQWGPPRWLVPGHGVRSAPPGSVGPGRQASEYRKYKRGLSPHPHPGLSFPICGERDWPRPPSSVHLGTVRSSGLPGDNEAARHRPGTASRGPRGGAGAGAGSASRPSLREGGSEGDNRRLFAGGRKGVIESHTHCQRPGEQWQSRGADAVLQCSRTCGAVAGD
ncbi:unnamed protein product [Gulo gulo]|uniref:Uncharacterized protein n=1 Tax=Gulo gulo TaxID=48420 RepID=A0A9X9MD11_GULGU|nr:unnamed protein product [Gulo gulo]